MRSLFYLNLFICLHFEGKTQTQSCELDTYGTDTINKIDLKNQKQGNWRVQGKHKPKACYNPDQLIETGHYLNNRKTGIWIEYHCKGGKMRSKLIYVDGVLDGAATFYNEKGEVLETGMFKSNKWVNEKTQ